MGKVLLVSTFPHCASQTSIYLHGAHRMSIFCAWYTSYPLCRNSILPGFCPKFRERFSRGSASQKYQIVHGLFFWVQGLNQSDSVAETWHFS